MVLSKPVLFSAVQPSGQLTLGNYIGALSKWAVRQNNYHCIYSIADLHSITVPQKASLLKGYKLDTLAFYLSVGIDPKKSIIFVQSEVYEHCQLNWILNCYTYFGELMRMTQFKKKSQQHVKNINAGLLNYPVLMSSDILLYQSDYIIIGKDQKQHLELARNIAVRFNSLYGNIFKIPDYHGSESFNIKIMSLLNPTKKMSKSDSNKNNIIFLLEDEKSILKKINRSTTDSENKIFYDPINKPGISNLLNIFSSLTRKKISILEHDFSGMLYHEFKVLVAQTISHSLNKLKDKFFYFRNNESYLLDILNEGTKKARLQAKKTLHKVYHTLGLLR